MRERRIQFWIGYVVHELPLVHMNGARYIDLESKREFKREVRVGNIIGLPFIYYGAMDTM